MSKWTTIIPALAMALAVPIQAAEVDSTQLIRLCRYSLTDAKKTTVELADTLQCLRYIEGFVAGASIVSGPRQFCIPNGVTLIQQVTAYITWADKHPDMWSLPRHVTLPKAFAEAFPCQK